MWTRLPLHGMCRCTSLLPSRMRLRPLLPPAYPALAQPELALLSAVMMGAQTQFAIMSP